MQPFNRYFRSLIIMLSGDANPVAYKQQTVSTTVLTLQSDILSLDADLQKNIAYAEIIFESSLASTSIAARYTLDGSVPASGTGMPLRSGGSVILTTREAINKFKIIQEGAGTHKMNTTFYLKPNLI